MQNYKEEKWWGLRAWKSGRSASISLDMQVSFMTHSFLLPTKYSRGKQLKLTKLRQEGKGSRPNAAKALSCSRRKRNWKSCGKLGTNDLETLLHTLWFTLTQHMGLRVDAKAPVCRCGRLSSWWRQKRRGIAAFWRLAMKRRGQLLKMFATNVSKCPQTIFVPSSNLQLEITIEVGEKSFSNHI